MGIHNRWRSTKNIKKRKPKHRAQLLFAGVRGRCGNERPMRDAREGLTLRMNHTKRKKGRLRCVLAISTPYRPFSSSCSPSCPFSQPILATSSTPDFFGSYYIYSYYYIRSLIQNKLFHELSNTTLSENLPN